MNAETLYVSRPIKRERRTKAKIETIESAIYDVLSEQHPATCRGVFYQLVSRGVVDKAETEYKGTVCRLLVNMRREGMIPFGWVADGTRWMRKSCSYTSIENMLNQSIDTYRRMMWATQDIYCEVWLEKDALAGTILDVTDSFDVPLMVSRGFSSITFLHSAGETIKNKNKPTVIYQLGDHDPSGVDIARHVEAELRRYAPKVDITFTRLAVTREQIEELHLSTRPTKITDTRARKFTGESVDVDAIPAPVLREMVNDAIVSNIDADAWNRNIDIENAERESLQRFAETWSQ